jgi:hypothetical protein
VLTDVRPSPRSGGDDDGSGGPPSLPTAPDDDGLSHARRSLLWRRAFVVALTAFVVAGAVGWLGVRTSQVRAEDDGLALVVTYPKVARPGLGIAWRVEITSATGFDGPVELTVPTGWLQRLDFMDQTPAPDGQESDGATTTFRWDSVEGTELLVVWDVRIEPGTFGWHDVDVQVETEVGDGARVVAARFRSWILP